MELDLTEEGKTEDFKMRGNRTIKVGDQVEVEHRGGNRYGTITQINIAINKYDPAGESGVRVNELDLELEYTGSISFKNDDSFPNEFWAYFNQIKDVYGHSEDEYDIHKYEAA